MKDIPKFGIITTTTLIEHIIILLKEYGCTNITIAEGTVMNKELLSDTKRGFKWSEINKAAKRHGVKLLDLNSAPFEKVQLGIPEFCTKYRSEAPKSPVYRSAGVILTRKRMTHTEQA